MKKLPCRLDSLEQLICYLRPSSSVLISDDKSGFLHMWMHARCKGLLRIHFGDEKYFFTCLPFGITSAPSVYQSESSQYLSKLLIGPFFNQSSSLLNP